MLTRSTSALILLASMTLSAMAQTPMPGKPELLGQFVLPTGLSIAGAEFGGISGLDYAADTGLFYAISDDRSQHGAARFYVLKLNADQEGVHGLEIVSSHVLLDLDGQPFAEKNIDPEAIRYDAARQSIFWSSEGDANGQPAIYEADLTGKALRVFALPEAYLPNADTTRGVQGNLGFESLSISPDGKTLLAGTENALVQDGGKATLEAGSLSRVIAFDIESGEPTAEYAYETGPIFAKATVEPAYNDNGMSEFLALDDSHLLTVERSFASGLGNEINLYVAALEGASDVAGQASLKDQSVTAAGKTAWLKLGEGDFDLDIDNIESVTFGPEIGGKSTLVIASDNNFNAAQFTQFVVFTLAE